MPKIAEEVARMTVEGVPVTSAALGARGRAVCPTHGLLESIGLSRCTSCEKQTYNLDDENERSALRSLRVVAKSQRTNRARLAAYPATYLLLAALLGPFSAVTFLLTAAVGEVVARALERAMRSVQRAAFRTVDAELLQ